MNEYILLTFESSNYAMQAESFLKSNKIKQNIIPTPREITSSCGLSIMIPLEYYDNVINFIDNGSIRKKQLYKVSLTNNQRVFTVIEK